MTNKPANPAVDYAAAARLVWQTVRARAEANGIPEPRGRRAGWMWTGNVSEVIRELWPELSDAESKRARTHLPGLLKGSVALEHRGGAPGSSHYWVAAEFLEAWRAKRLADEPEPIKVPQATVPPARFETKHLPPEDIPTYEELLARIDLLTGERHEMQDAINEGVAALEEAKVEIEKMRQALVDVEQDHQSLREFTRVLEETMSHIRIVDLPGGGRVFLGSSVNVAKASRLEMRLLDALHEALRTYEDKIEAGQWDNPLSAPPARPLLTGLPGDPTP